MSRSSRPKHDLSASRVSSDLLMQRSRPNRTHRPIRDTTYDEEADAALQTALATEEIGVRTLIKLKEQTEQMHNIEDRITAADQTLVSTDRSIRSMSSFTGRLKNFFTRSDPKTDIQMRKKQEAKVLVKEAKVVEKSRAKRNERMTKQERPQKNARASTSNDERLDAISESVRNLHLMAEDMNQELTTQNRILSGIGQDIQSLQTRIEKQSRQINRLQ